MKAHLQFEKTSLFEKDAKKEMYWENFFVDYISLGKNFDLENSFNNITRLLLSNTS